MGMEKVKFFDNIYMLYVIYVRFEIIKNSSNNSQTLQKKVCVCILKRFKQIQEKKIKRVLCVMFMNNTCREREKKGGQLNGKFMVFYWRAH